MDEDDPDFRELERVFSEPLADADPIRVASQEEADDEVESIYADLTTFSSWDVPRKALIRFRDLLAGQLMRFRRADTGKIIEACVPLLAHESLRMDVMISVSACVLAPLPIRIFDQIGRELVDLLWRAIAVRDMRLANAAHMALLNIMIRSLRLSLSIISRPDAGEDWLKLLIVEAAWTVAELTNKHRAIVMETQRKYEGDPNELVRATAAALGGLRQTRESTVRFVDLRRLSSRRGRRAPRGGDRLMDHRRRWDPVEWKKELDSRRRQGNWEGFNLDRFVEDLEAAVPSTSDWPEVLSALLSRFEARLRPQAVRILVIFGFADWAVDVVDQKLGLQRVAEEIGSTSQHAQAVQFFSRLLGRLDRTPQLEQVLRGVVRSHSRRDPGRPEKVQACLDALAEYANERNREPFEAMAAKAAGEPITVSMESMERMDAASVESGLNEALVKRVGTSADAIARFVRDTSLDKVSFAETIEALLESGAKLASAAAARHFSDPRVAAVVLRGVEQGQMRALKSVLLFARDSQEQLLWVEEAVADKVLPLLRSEQMRVRIRAARVLAACLRKLPRTFGSRLTELSPARRRLVDLCAEAMGSASGVWSPPGGGGHGP
jgi:hypothetical protein